MADPWKTEGSKRPTVADDKTAAERARQMYPVARDQVRAETLEALANDEADWARKAWRSGEAETVSKMRKAILGRAAEYRKATSA